MSGQASKEKLCLKNIPKQTLVRIEELGPIGGNGEGLLVGKLVVDDELCFVRIDYTLGGLREVRHLFDSFTETDWDNLEVFLQNNSEECPIFRVREPLENGYILTIDGNVEAELVGCRLF